MLRVAFLAALLVAVPLLASPAVGQTQACPTPTGPASDPSLVNLNGRAYVTLDGRLYTESNNFPGLQRSAGSCVQGPVTRTWSADQLLF